ncbi:MAG: hypothetical protein ACI94Y_002356 [Maribacter sp.]|jgi:hypothetical protein
MKKINFKTFFTFLVVSASICSYTFLSNVDKVTEPLVSAKNEVMLEKENIEAEASAFMSDVSILSKTIEFVSENLPAD